MSYHTSAPRQTTTTTSTQVKIAPVGYHYMPDGTLMLNSEMNTDEYDVDYEGQKVITLIWIFQRFLPRVGLEGFL